MGDVCSRTYMPQISVSEGTLLHVLQRSMSSPKLAACCLNVVSWLIFMSTFYFSATSEPTQISFPQFSANDSSMRALGDIKYNEDNHSIILNAKSAADSTGTCGLLIYAKDDVRIQDTATGRVATFNTSFTFTFTSPSEQQAVWNSNSTSGNATVGTRLTFAVVDSYLGLVAMQEVESWVSKPGACSTDSPVAPYFSIAFDTDYSYNWGDPSNNFIAVYNIGVSKQVRKLQIEPASYLYNLCGNKTQYCSYLSTGRSFTAWIDLTSKRTLEVRLLTGSAYPHVEKPLIPLIEFPNFELPQGMGDNVSLSFRGSSDVNHITAHEISSWSFNCSDILEPTPLSENARNKVQYILGISGTVVGFLILVSLSLWLPRRCTRRRSTTTDSSIPSVFSYKELRIATKNFNESEKLGSGGFGTVYRGSFGSTSVAVKRINYDSEYAKTSFLAEISSLGLIRHRNVVQLLGWCHEKGRLLLVYDYMPNGSLNEWLHKSGSNYKHKLVLSCKLRHCILDEVAAAIEYLHTDCPQCVLHRDIKSSNVMLDANFIAHLGDFGLARLMDHHKLDKTTMAAGTFGYMAPEMPFTGKATKESDVYSFGILVLEVVCGRQPLDMKAPEPEDLVLLYSAWRAHEAGTLLDMADPRLLQTRPPPSVTSRHGESRSATQPLPSNSNSLHLNDINITISGTENTDVEVEKMMIKHLLHLGLLCCLPNPKARPTMGHVIRILQQIGDIENADYLVTNISMPPLPHTKPLGLYPSIEFSQTADSSLQQFRTYTHAL